MKRANRSLNLTPINFKMPSYKRIDKNSTMAKKKGNSGSSSTKKTKKGAKNNGEKSKKVNENQQNEIPTNDSGNQDKVSAEVSPNNRNSSEPEHSSLAMNNDVQMETEAQVNSEISNEEINYFDLIEKGKKGLLDAYQAHKSPKVEFSFDSLIATKSGDVMNKMWEALNEIATECALDIFPNDLADEGKFKTEESEIAINGILLLARLTVEDQRISQKNEFIPPTGLLQTVQLLHNLLPLITPTKDSVRNNISKLCELWYKKRLSESDTLITNALIYLLMRATRKDSSPLGVLPVKADITRVHNVQNAILDHNIGDSASRPLRDLLIDAAKTPIFYKTIDGIRFLAFLFTISPSFIQQLHTSIKTIIPGASAQIANAIGEVYFKAWRSCEGVFKSNIEEQCIQDLMLRGIVANPNLPKNLKIFLPIRNLLKVLHRAKNDRQAQAMLAKLYEPILWRHLKVANCQVRSNAAQLFYDAFPVEDPSLQLEERAMKYEEQVQMMCELLKDEVPEVRIVSIQGASLLIAKYFQILSSTDLNKLVKIFVVDLAVDASSSQVRLEVLKGFKHITNTCVRSHLYMKKILPKIRDNLHDIKETVRHAMVDLLTAVSNVKMIRYWDICPIEQILARLEVEKSDVICRKITDVLFNSYFPIGEDEYTKIRRCIILIQQNQAAARKFYNIAPKILPIHHQVKFMLAILVALKKNLKFKYGPKKTTENNLSLPGTNRVGKNQAPHENFESDNFSDTESEADKENTESSLEASLSGKRKKRKKLYSQPKQSSKNPPNIIPQDFTQSSVDGRDSSMERSMSLDTSTNNFKGPNDTTLQQENVERQENEESLIQELSDEKIVAALLDVVCILWMSRGTEFAKEDEENAAYRSLLEKKASKLVSVLFKYYRSSEVSRSLVYLCSFLPHSTVSTIAGFCLSQLRNSTNITNNDPSAETGHADKQSEKPFDIEWTGMESQVFLDISNPLPTYIDALCNWNRGDDIMELIINWLSRSLRERQMNNRKSGVGRKSNINRKGVRFSESAGLGVAKPELAIQLIRYMFRHPVNRDILLRKNRLQVKELRNLLGQFVEEIVQYLSTADISTSAEVNPDTSQIFLCEIWQSLLILTLLLHQPNKEAMEKGANVLQDSRTNGQKKVNKSTRRSIENTGETEETEEVFVILEEYIELAEKNIISLPQLYKHTFSLRVLNYLINACSNAATLNIADTNFIGLSLEFASNFLETLERSLTLLENEKSNLYDDQNHELQKNFNDITSSCLKPICR